MLGSLKEAGKHIGRELNRAWEGLAEGWRGMEKDDCHISIERNVLYLSGEKRLERETHDSTHHVMERAYGAFRRAIALPRNVDVERAAASYKNGVLTVRLPKTGVGGATTIPVS